MMKLCGKTIPEVAEQIKGFMGETINKPSGEYKFIIGEEYMLPVIIDVQRNEAAKISKIQAKLGLVHIAGGQVHYDVPGNRNKNYQTERNELLNQVDENIWTVVNIILFSDSSFINRLQDLFSEEHVSTIQSDIYGITVQYHLEDDSQRFLISHNDGTPIYALEEAYSPLAGGFLTTPDSQKDAVFKICLKIIKQDSFELDWKMINGHSEETSSQDS